MGLAAPPPYNRSVECLELFNLGDGCLDVLPVDHVGLRCGRGQGTGSAYESRLVIAPINPTLTRANLIRVKTRIVPEASRSIHLRRQQTVLSSLLYAPDGCPPGGGSSRDLYCRMSPPLVHFPTGFQGFGLMGRGRGKGKKLTVVTSHEDLGGGDEVFPVYKRRGRPQKPLKEDAIENDVGKIEEEEEDGIVKAAVPENEVKVPTTLENGKKRKRSPQIKENSNSVLEEDAPNMRSSFDDSTRPNGFRQNGSRRKSTPRRAAVGMLVHPGHHCSVLFHGTTREMFIVRAPGQMICPGVQASTAVLGSAELRGARSSGDAQCSKVSSNAQTNLALGRTALLFLNVVQLLAAAPWNPKLIEESQVAARIRGLAVCLVPVK
ncbi:hypothetical protein Taro_001921 [Colocasia esculenta]|uniref:Uncharacterized protein n=1 Tax=Colocasia esculenta TaxID=4460 RepID=A0A843TF35_COLES|nr:hypothetical protein [Colocasia esculenta]